VRILMVDDSEDSRELTEAALLSAGYDDIVAAVSGRETLKFLDIDRASDDTVPVDIMLLDIVMPEMDGIEVCAHVRNDARYVDLPIIMVTSVDDVSSLANAFVAGATDYVAKPVNPIELTTRMRVALRRKQEANHQSARARDVLVAGNPSGEQKAPAGTLATNGAKNASARDRSLEVITSVEKNKFRTRLQNERGKLEAIQAKLHGSPAASQDFEELQVVVHKLAGAAGIFGFAEVSQSAAELEELIIETKSDSRSAESINGELAELLRVIEQECAALDQP
jgi:DNA-binding response OmpR family regulator/HPt (histidine-containing phosphotransfer) domain-containing protein